jgi:hypothetical protein
MKIYKDVKNALCRLGLHIETLLQNHQLFYLILVIVMIVLEVVVVFVFVASDPLLFPSKHYPSYSVVCKLSNLSRFRSRLE